VEILNAISSFVWGPVTIVLLVGTGIYLTIRMRFIQLLGFGHAWKLISGKYDDHKDEGDVTHFQALATALSATIGTGNIAGVATAIAAGGPGALFWMWVTAVFGMATKYTSCLLALKYRTINPDGSASGGPMYYLAKGLGQRWLGILFAFFAMTASFGIGNMVQANSVAEPLLELGVPKEATGAVMFVLVGLVILGGIRRIASVASKIVPFMCIIYVLGALVILGMQIEQIPAAFKLIFYHAFNPTAAAGGFLGSTVAQAMRFGVARGLFSNEAGLGSAPIAHAAAKTKFPAREGLVAMLGPFIDTLVICSMTGLVIVISGLWTATDAVTGKQLTGAVLSAQAFDAALPGFGHYIVSFGIVFFAFSTIISWSYYGDRSAEFLFGRRAILPYRIVYTLMVPVGAALSLPVVWTVSDIMNGLMAFPNLIGLLLLSGVVARETRTYFDSEHASPNKN
jgi:AGCS family alanine or glycine:cation symporter